MKKQVFDICYVLTGIARLHPAPAIFAMSSQDLFKHLVRQYVIMRKALVLDVDGTVAGANTVMDMLCQDKSIPHLGMYLRDRAVLSAYRTYITELYSALDVMFIGSKDTMPVPVELVRTFAPHVRTIRTRTFGEVILLAFRKGQ